MDDLLALFDNLHVRQTVHDKLEEKVIKFLQFLPQLLKHGDYAKSYHLGKLTEAIRRFEINNASFNFEFYYCGSGEEKIYVSDYRDVLNDSKLTYIVYHCFKTLFMYVRWSVEHTVMQLDDKFTEMIVETVAHTYKMLLSNRAWLDTTEISKEIESFLELLLEILANIDASTFEQKYNIYVLLRKLLFLFKTEESCRRVIIDFIDRKLIRFLEERQNGGEPNCGAWESLVNMLTVLKVMLEYKYKPKEEILRTIVKDIHERCKNTHTIDRDRNDLTKTLKRVKNCVPKYIQLLVDECINIMIPANDY